MAGANPSTAAEVNAAVGSILRQFMLNREQVARYQDFMAATDLLAPPYSMAQADNDNIKSALSTLDTALQAYDTVFVDRLTGLY
jgi:hypothetical protein